ncbi:hypothetical protein F0562_005425 [Nyssa sinensis]|uniref:Plastid movement impaired protein n=1 Tax=Nyssa sinensis TaxID=561372 RepID=A0A5J5ANJ1_9ASTE|nr:hypothetical protein F0562_005425 [Nyssa sinensis]
MGNNIGGRKKAKVMKITGETFKLKTPVRAGDVVNDYPGHVLLESEAVKKFGIRAKPLEPQEELQPRKIYFLVELPKLPEEKAPRRVRSSVQMSAKDRLECLMLSRRSVSDLAIARPTTRSLVPNEPGPSSGPVRVKMRLPKAQVAKLVEESRDEAEVAEKIIDLYMENAGDVSPAASVEDEGLLLQRPVHWRPGLGSIKESLKAREIYVYI